MDVRISGRHFEVTESLHEHVTKKVENFEKYLHNLIDVHVILSVEKYRQCAEISVFGKKLKITEKSIATDMYAASWRAGQRFSSMPSASITCFMRRT